MFTKGIDHWFAVFRASGDPRALARVFDAAAPELWRVASHLTRDRHVAEDAVQSTFLAAIEVRAEWDAARPLLPWLLGLLVNRVHEERRRAARAPAADRVAPPRGEGDPLAAVAARELDGTVRTAIVGLDEPYRSTLEQQLLEGRSADEIARRAGVAAGTVRMRLHRGLDHLRRRLPKGLVAGAGALVLTRPSLAAMRTVVLAAAPPASRATAGGPIANAVRIPRAPAAAMALVAAIAVAAAGWSLRAPAADPAPAQGTAAIDTASPTARTAAVAQDPAATAAPERAAAAGPVGELRVRVLAVGSLRPVAGAALTVVPDRATGERSPSPLAVRDGAVTPADVHEAGAGYDGITDDSGVAVFTLPAGGARLEVRTPAPAAESLRVAAGGRTEHVVFLAVPVPVDVQVLDAAATPVAGARVVARVLDDSVPADAVVGRTDGDGRWRGPLPPRRLLLRAWADGLACVDAAIVSPQHTAATLHVTGAAGGVAGTVRDAAGTPVAGAGVAAAPTDADAGSLRGACHVARTDADGRYRFGHLAAGQYTIHAWHGERDVRRIARCTVEVTAAQTAQADVALAPGVRIVVELTRSDGRPVPGASFHATCAAQPDHGPFVGRIVSTDERGMAIVEGLPPGRYTLTAAAATHQVTEHVELHDGQQLTFRRELGGVAPVEVQVNDARGEPVQGLDVRLHAAAPWTPEHDVLGPAGRATSTDERGVARFDGQDGGPMWATVRSRAAPWPIAWREIAPGTRTTLVIAAAQLARRRLCGRVEGDAVRFAVTLVPLPAGSAAPGFFGGAAPAEVDADGRFVFADVPPGTYGLMVHADARGSAGGAALVAWRRGVVVPEDHDVDLGTIVARSADVRCRLLRGDGTALANPRVLLRLAPSFPFQSWSQALDGSSVRLDRLPAGVCDVLVVADDAAPTLGTVTVPLAADGATFVASPANAVAVRFEDLPAESARGEMRVLRGRRVWFAETVRDAREPYRCGLPPGSYTFEYRPDDARRGRCWAAEVAVEQAAVTIAARRRE